MTGAEQLIDLIYDAALEPRLWTTVMERLADLVGGTSGWLSQINVADGSGKRQDDPVLRADPIWSRRYREYYAALSPFAIDPNPGEFIRHWTPRVLTHDDQIPREELRRTEFYNDFLQPYGIGSGMMIRLAKSGFETATLNLHCSPRKDRFGAADIETAAYFQPHLMRAFSLGRRLAEERLLAGVFGPAPDTSIHGLFVLDETGRIVRANATGEALLAGGRGLKAVGGRLSTLMSNDARTLEALVRAALCPDAGLRTGGAMSIAIPQATKPLAVSVAPINPERAWPYRLAATAIVCATDLNVHLGPPDERIGAIFGLTRAERRLVLALLGGESPRATAARFGVTFQTVRNQLARIYEKTATRGQIELVALMWRIVSAEEWRHG